MEETFCRVDEGLVEVLGRAIGIEGPFTNFWGGVHGSASCTANVRPVVN